MCDASSSPVTLPHHLNHEICRFLLHNRKGKQPKGIDHRIIFRQIHLSCASYVVLPVLVLLKAEVCKPTHNGRAESLAAFMIGYCTCNDTRR
ncbi:hypothetical protein LY76DRAFT_182177 [Colletotrichum caudatum]|nr:hypothetical protein LY76DRAFT_182177 [Colletotrichum caudatum]